MLREVLHFLIHVPGFVRLSLSRSHAEIFEELMERAEGAGFAQHRAALVEGLEGDVIEIGCGTGRMFPHYSPAARVSAVEPDERFVRIAATRAAAARAQIDLQVASAMALPFEAGRFDHAVVCNVLCSVPSCSQVLAELERVLRPAAELRLIEHVRSERPVVGACMHLFNPLWRLWNRQGCNMNRRLESPLEEAGFRIAEVERFQIFCPGIPAFPSQRIRALRASAGS